jgi:peroxiredoxin Q/BCP
MTPPAPLATTKHAVTSSPRLSPSLGWQAVGLIVAVGILGRLGCSWADIKLWPDSSAYITSAQALLTGDFAAYFPERTPGLPLLLAGLMALFGGPQTAVTAGQLPIWVTLFIGLQAAFGVTSGLLVAFTTTHLTGRRVAGLTAGLVAVCLPDVILYEHSLLSESLYTLALCLLTFALVRYRLTQRESTRASALWRGSLLGAILTLCIWTRAIALPVAIALGLIMAAQRRWPALLVTAAWLTLTVGGWVVFHQNVHEVATYAASGGLNQLYKVVDFIELPPQANAQARSFYQQVRSARALFPAHATYEAVNQGHLMAYWAEKGARPYWQSYLAHDAQASNIAQYSALKNPWAYLQSTAKECWRLLTLNTPWDTNNLVWWPLLALGSLGLYTQCYRLRTAPCANVLASPTLWLTVIILAHLALYPCITVSDARYRIPLEVLLILGSAYLFVNQKGPDMSHPALQTTNFSLLDPQGQSVSWASMLGPQNGGKWTVVFFYPKDGTAGCTAQVCAFRDAYQDFVDAGAVVVGISSDSDASHAQFSSQHNLPFVLLSDPKGEARKAFGVPKTLGVIPGRATYIIDPEGVIRHRFVSQLNIAEHVRQALAIIRGDAI